MNLLKTEREQNINCGELPGIAAKVPVKAGLAVTAALPLVPAGASGWRVW